MSQSCRIERVDSHLIELRTGLTGHSLEVNGLQVFFFAAQYEELAHDTYQRLILAIKLKPNLTPL